MPKNINEIIKLRVTPGIVIRKEQLAKRCEICHQTDYFDPINNFCSRCRILINRLDQNRPPVYTFEVILERFITGSIKITKLILILILILICSGLVWHNRKARSLEDVRFLSLSIFYQIDIFKASSLERQFEMCRLTYNSTDPHPYPNFTFTQGFVETHRDVIIPFLSKKLNSEQNEDTYECSLIILSDMALTTRDLRNQTDLIHSIEQVIGKMKNNVIKEHCQRELNHIRNEYPINRTNAIW